MKLAPKRRSWCCRSIAAKRKAIRFFVVPRDATENFNDIHDSSINPILNLLTQVQIRFVAMTKSRRREWFPSFIFMLPVQHGVYDMQPAS